MAYASYSGKEKSSQRCAREGNLQNTHSTRSPAPSSSSTQQHKNVVLQNTAVTESSLFSLFLSQQGQTHIFKNHLEKTAWQKWGMQWSTLAQKFKVRISYALDNLKQYKLSQRHFVQLIHKIHCQLGTHVGFFCF